MTCIVGIVDGKRVVLGGDNAAIAGWDVQPRKDEKVFSLGDIAIGFTSSFRMGQVLKYQLVPPPRPEAMDEFEYLSTLFVDAVRKCFKDSGFATTKEGGEIGGCFLVGYHGRIFSIESDYQVAEWSCGFAAVGCGSQTALGALRMVQSVQTKLEHYHSAEQKLQFALSAAEEFNAGVRAPFSFVSVQKPEEKAREQSA